MQSHKTDIINRLPADGHREFITTQSSTGMPESLAKAVVLAFGFVVVLDVAGTIIQWHRHGIEYENKSGRYKYAARDGNFSSRSAIKWLIWPMITLVGLFAFAMHPDPVLNAIPAAFSSYEGASLNKFLPLHPKNFMETFHLTQLYDQLVSTESSAIVSSILSKASGIADRNVTKEMLLNLPNQLAEIDARQGSLRRILGFFTFVNIIWLVSILGLTVVTGPFLMRLATPISILFVTISILFVTVWEQVIWRLLIIMKPLYEPLCYLLSFLLIAESARYPHDAYSMAGTMTAITGIAVFSTSWLYTTYKNSSSGGDKQIWTTLTAAWIAGAAIPTAKIHQSTLIGYIGVAAALTCLGFGGFGDGLLIRIGWKCESAAARAAIVTLFGTLAFTTLHIMGVPSPWLEPFKSAVTVYGTAVYFLALWICGFADVEPTHIPYILSVLVCLLVGEMWGLQGMSNVAKTYGGLGIFTAFCVYCPKETKDSRIVFVFSLSLTCYVGSLYLSRHPQYVVALFGP